MSPLHLHRIHLPRLWDLSFFPIFIVPLPYFTLLPITFTILLFTIAIYHNFMFTWIRCGWCHVFLRDTHHYSIFLPYTCNIVQLNSFYIKFESKLFYLNIINTITNWQVSLSKIYHEWPNNAVKHGCVQRMRELHCLVMHTFVSYHSSISCSVSVVILLLDESRGYIGILLFLFPVFSMIQKPSM